MNALAFILDRVRTNSRTIYREVNGVDISNFQYTYQLGKALVLPAVQKRYENSNGLSTKLLDKMKGVLGLNLNVKRVVAENTNPSSASKDVFKMLEGYKWSRIQRSKKEIEHEVENYLQIVRNSCLCKHLVIICSISTIPIHILSHHLSSFYSFWCFTGIDNACVICKVTWCGMFQRKF